MRWRPRPRGRKWSSLGAPRVEEGATSRRNDEPRMNEAGRALETGARYFSATIARSVVTRRRRARMGDYRSPTPQGRPRDDHSSKIIVHICGGGFCRVRAERARAGSEHDGMQRKIQSGQGCGHAQRPEVERFPQGQLRRRRRSQRPAAAPAAAPAPERRKPPSRKPAAAPAPVPTGNAVFPSAVVRNMPRKAPARPGCTPASISTRPTRTATPMAA